jgi:hypothetical protein
MMPVMASVFGDILTGVESAVTASGVSLAGGIVVRKSLKKLPADTLPKVIIAPGSDSVAGYATENVANIAYRVYVAIIYAGNTTMQTGLSSVLDARQAIRRKLAATTMGAADEVYDAEIELNPPFEPEMLDKNYEYALLGVVYTASEPRTE